ncbi:MULTISPECIES: hypothetical protein [unclassified Fusibacter]|uniref:hypothetical protein n=1 Tax=unclassified Fusibacter TaxID=2624464 RepID=UPI0010119CDC|nr:MULTISPECIES: hypothetical protein [unclassified Fusibacter]MCK8060493.1 hypothetical protein [Fusibacter sp. A2]NPE20218.1 hypothetical protein [Fusibacter sp. A1]RXV63427.1 hypothetical protein DWB64_00200 [Fusibacter sp. A1]
MRNVLKGVLLFPLIILLIALGVVLQFFIGAQKTVMDSTDFEEFVISNNIGENLYESLVGLVNNAEEYVQVDFGNGDVYDEPSDFEHLKEEQADFIDSIKKRTIESLDRSYFVDEIPLVLVEFHKYYFQGGTQLPTINIRPIKELIFELAVQDMKLKLGEDASEEAEAFIQTIKKYNAKGMTKEEMLDEFSESEFVLDYSLDRSLLARLIELVTENPDKDTKEVLDVLIREKIRVQVEYDKVADSLDIEEYFFRVYGSNVNPVSEFPTLIAKIRGSVSAILFVTLFMLIIIMYLICGRIIGFSKWLGVTTTITGAVVFLPSLIMRIFKVPMISSYFESIIVPEISEQISGMTDFITAYFMEGLSTMMMISAVVSLVGIGLIMASVYDQSSGVKSEVSSGTLVVRIAFALICLVIIPVHFLFQGMQIERATSQFDYMITQMEVTSADRDSILLELLEAQKLMDAYDNINRQ